MVYAFYLNKAVRGKKGVDRKLAAQQGRGMVKGRTPLGKLQQSPVSTLCHSCVVVVFRENGYAYISFSLQEETWPHSLV